MNLFTILIGIAILGLGIGSHLERTYRKTESRKLAGMKKFWGEDFGNKLHFFLYVIVPIALGLLVAYAGIQGLAPMDALEQGMRVVRPRA